MGSPIQECHRVALIGVDVATSNEDHKASLRLELVCICPAAVRVDQDLGILEVDLSKSQASIFAALGFFEQAVEVDQVVDGRLAGHV